MKKNDWVWNCLPWNFPKSGSVHNSSILISFYRFSPWSPKSYISFSVCNYNSEWCWYSSPACYIPHPSESSSFHYANNFFLWWSVNITELYINLHLLIPFLMCIYSFLYFILIIHYTNQKFPPKPRKTLGTSMRYWSLTSTQPEQLYLGHMMSGRLICRDRATSAIWCVNCKLWRHGTTHTLVPADATSRKSPFTNRKASVCRRSMDWRCSVVVFISENQFQLHISRIRYKRSNSLCYVTKKVFWDISHNAFFAPFSKLFGVLIQSGYISIGLAELGLFVLLGQGARNHQLPT